MTTHGFRYLARQGIENIWKNKMMAFATFCVLLISLLLVGTASLFSMNMNSMITGLGNQNEIAVYIEQGTPSERVAEFQAELLAVENVNNVSYISKQQALEKVQGEISERGQAIFNYIEDYEFMPDGFTVTVKNNDEIEKTADIISEFDDVDEVYVSKEVTQVLRDLRNIVTVIMTAVMIALIAVSIIMISNTTKASVYSRREEIQIMKYVGATDFFIRTPFFIEGMVTGLVAGITAFFITWGIYSSVYDLMQETEKLVTAVGRNSLIPFSEVRIPVALCYILAGSLLGAVGSVISTRRHLDV